jgi:feruloyl esterase
MAQSDVARIPAEEDIMKDIAVAAALLLAFAGSARAAGTACEDLARISLPHTEITAARLISRGTFPAPAGRNGGPPDPVFATMPDLCRVTATSRPTADSDIRIEVWLPVTGWNGRLEAVGNGGFGSNISLNNLAQGVAAGYAMVGSNSGHEGNSGEFAFGHPEKLVDWGYRAVHEMTITAKAVVAAHYGNPAKYSYWNACSTGGRQGMMAAEFYPGDFDQANPMTRNQANTLYGNLAMNKDAASIMSQAKWLAYRKAVMDKCDAADGLKDGLLNNPLACKFDPQAMLCKGADSDDCLTAPQIAALKKLLAGMKNPRTGEQLHPGWPVGAQPLPFVWGPKPEQVAIDTFRALFQKPDWDYHTMDFDKDIALADKLGDGLIDAVQPARMKPLFDRGGKIILYHGWSDPNISALLTIDTYKKAVAANGGLARTDKSMRLFMVPGMLHCQGGDGPNAFDKMEALTVWVEQGKAPDEIVASHSNAQGQVDRTRPLCPYPKVAKYKGSGSIDEARSFSCAAP